MRSLYPASILILTFGLCLRTQAQIYDTNGDFVQTFAGSGFYGHVDGTGVNTMFHNPDSIVADSNSNLFVWDSRNYVVRKLTPDGVVTTFAGGGNQPGGFGTNVNLSPIGYGGPGLLAIDRNDSLWKAVWQSGQAIAIYRITSNALVTNFVVSTPPQNTFSSDEPVGICVDSKGTIYISFYYGNQIYKWTTNGGLVLFAGSENPGSADGNGIFTSFQYPLTLTADEADNIYVWDFGNRLIRRISQNGDVHTIAGKTASLNADGVGTNAAFTSVYQMAFDHSGNLLLACDSSIRKIDAQTNVVTMAGSFTQFDYTNGVAGNLARFNGASGICVAQGAVFIADSLNQRIRNITFNPTSQTVSPANLELSTYPGLRIVGAVGRTYEIQSSSDLSAWNTRSTVVLSSSPYLWFDRNPVAGNQYYRALLLP